ncbi:MAG: lysophospholipid acyltransferase family protein [Planctomycetes bacterium]|nr:lysophospholipid acyltransferase family protein [Planctomycetota bacterium]MBI3846971.1 lysophospholipid acyltransferase family protein [Planctomycetota bacterium]
MSRRRHVDRTEPTLSDRVQYVLLRALIGFIRFLPVRAAYALGNGVGSLLFLVDRRHRAIALDNLRAAFPEKSEDDRRSIARGAFRSFVLVAIELAMLGRRLEPENWRAQIEVREFQRVDDGTRDGRGCIFMTGHFGNWEVLGAWMAITGHPFHSVARPIDNPLVDQLLRGMREQFGQKIVTKRGALRELIRVLRDGGYLGFVADQDARSRGLFVEFFGRAASTEPGPATLAVKLGIPIVVGFCWRVAPFRFVAEATALLRPDPSADRDADVQRLTQEYSLALESMVRRHPEQWLWLHRRWKTQPSALTPRESFQMP